MRLYCIHILVAILLIAISASAQTQNDSVAMPDLVGMEEEKANETLRSDNLTPNFEYDYSDTLGKGFVIEQEYPAGTEILSGEVVTIAISKGPYPVSIESPKRNEHVESMVIVNGDTSRSLSKDAMLWIAVNPKKSPRDYWPQSGGPLPLYRDGTFNGVAFLGGENGDPFDIVVLILNQTLSDAFSRYIDACSAVNNWPPITQEGDGYKIVSSEAILDHEGDRVAVILGE